MFLTYRYQTAVTNTKAHLPQSLSQARGALKKMPQLKHCKKYFNKTTKLLFGSHDQTRLEQNNFIGIIYEQTPRTSLCQITCEDALTHIEGRMAQVDVRAHRPHTEVVPLHLANRKPVFIFTPA